MTEGRGKEKEVRRKKEREEKLKGNFLFQALV